MNRHRPARAVADGERVLPLLGLEVRRPGGVLEGIAISYRDTDGDVGTVTAPVGMRLSRGGC